MVARPRIELGTQGFSVHHVKSNQLILLYYFMLEITENGVRCRTVSYSNKITSNSG